IELSNSLFSNDWYNSEQASSTEEILQHLVNVDSNPLFPISIMPSSPDSRKIKASQKMNTKLTKKALRKMTRFFKELQNEEMFDIILVNVPYLTPHTINGMMVADYNFVLLDHDRFSFNLFEQYVTSLVGIYPTLNIAGLILHRFQFSPAPENDAVTISLIEDQLRYPVILKLPSLRDQVFTEPINQLWLSHDQKLQDFFESVALSFLIFAQSPRRVEKKKTKLVYYQLYIVHHSGIPLLRYTFKKDKETKDEILASAGLTSILIGTETMISELVNRQETTKLIEMHGVKIIIEQWKNVKVILLTNLYEESTRRRIKALTRHFVQRYSNELAKFLGNIQPFEDAYSLVEEHFLQKAPVEKEETLPLSLIRGIGKSRAWELQNIGIFSINHLIKSDAVSVANKVNLNISVVENWISQAKKLLNEN
ncbi:MAG: hypothetical protein ACFFAE_22740, partial [Candidatus Hodarchaeota archaeon]